MEFQVQNARLKIQTRQQNSSTIALGSLVYAYRLKKKSNSDDNQIQDLETVNV